MWCALPALAVILLWLAFQDAIILRLVTDHLPAGVRDLPRNELSLVLNDVRNLVAGNVPAGSVSESVRGAAAEYMQLRGISRMALTVLVMVMAVGTMLVVRSRITPELRARNRVESGDRVAVDRLLDHRGVHHHRHRGLRGLRGIPLLLAHSPYSISCSALSWSPQMAIRADQVGSSGIVRRRAAVRGHGADFVDRHADRGADRPVFGYLPGRIRASQRFAPGPSRCSKCSRACPPSCTASSRR